MHDIKYYEALALKEAAKSPCAKRKVGAVIVNPEGSIIGVGHNSFTTITNKPCEDVLGFTHPDIVHAEIHAIEDARSFSPGACIGATIYVTHQPCEGCADAIIAAGLKLHVVAKSDRPQTLSSTLQERNKAHGDFTTSSITVQALKTAMHNSANWAILPAAQKESLEMIVHKIGRILHGDPNVIDTWHDISGYATLIENYLTKKGENNARD